MLDFTCLGFLKSESFQYSVSNQRVHSKKCDVDFSKCLKTELGNLFELCSFQFCDLSQFNYRKCFDPTKKTQIHSFLWDNKRIQNILMILRK